MDETKQNLEAELARLDALQNQGVRMTVCGKPVVMKTRPFLEVMTIGKQIFGKAQAGFGSAESGIAQGVIVTDAFREAIITIFTNDGVQQITADDLDKLDDADIRKIMMVFTHLHELSVKRLGELLAPVFPFLQSEFTGAVSSLLPKPLANG